MPSREQLLDICRTEERLALAYSEGSESAKTDRYECDYSSGSGLYAEFCKGFVAQASQQEGLPKDTPMYLAGRIAFLKGLPIESKPESESFAGRWFSGWLAEKRAVSA